MEKSVAPSAPLPELDNNAVQTHVPPPTYDQAMSIPPPLVPSAHHSGAPTVLPPYPQPNMPYPPAQQPNVPYPIMPQPQMPYPQVPPAQHAVPYPQVPLAQPQQFVPPGTVQQRPQPNSLPSQPQASQEAPPTTVFVNTPVAVGPKPCRLRCPYCHADIKTSTETENQAAAHIACVIMCLLGCCLCSCIPYCMDSCKIVQHKCPLCKSFLGTYKA